MAVAVAPVGSVLLSTPAPAHALSDTDSGGQFVSAQGRFFGAKLTATTWTTIQIGGRYGVPSTGVSAVSLMATVANPTAQGILLGSPSADESASQIFVYGGGSLGNTSNTGILAVADDGSIQVRTQTAETVYLDIQRYYTSDDSGVAPGGFVPVAGSRVADTINGVGVAKATVGPGASITFQVTGNAGVPAGASAVAANITVKNEASNAGYITPYAAGAARPSTSLNYPTVKGGATAFGAQVALSSAGRTTIANPAWGC